MNPVQVIREALETHLIEPDPTRNVYETPRLTQKCAGCNWIGFDHTLHVAKIIDVALGLVKHAETIPVFVYDDPPAMAWWGLEEVPARHLEFIPHTRLTSPWCGEACPDCAAEPGIHDRRHAEILAATLKDNP